jgi:uncharacterized protein (UPF0335 family)
MTETATNAESHRVESEQLKAIHQRILRLRAEKKDAAEAETEVFAEAKSAGYDTKVLRKVIAQMERDANEVAEEAALMKMYTDALA